MTLLKAGQLAGINIDAGKRILLMGGDHSTALGAIRATAARHPGLGILHIDAHADLRVAYEGFERSHASVLHNALAEEIAPELGCASNIARPHTNDAIMAGVMIALMRRRSIFLKVSDIWDPGSASQW